MSLSEVVGANARRLRGDATADEVAKAARQAGLNWGTGRISDLEHGRVSPTIPTLIALAHAFYGVHNRPVSLADLVEHDGFVALTSDLTISGDALQRFLKGEPVFIKVRDVPRDPELMKRARENLAPEAFGRLLTDLPAVLDDVPTKTYLQVRRNSGETEARIAKSLAVPEDHVAWVSAHLWGHTLSAERDRRAGESANAQQRGRMTRQLKAEIQAVLNGDD